MMKTINPYGALKDKMRLLIEVLAPPGRAQAFIAQADCAVGPLDLDAYLKGALRASVMFHGEEINFVCAPGLQGCLYPNFMLDSDSITMLPDHSTLDIFAVLKRLHLLFITADEVYLNDDQDMSDEDA